MYTKNIIIFINFLVLIFSPIYGFCDTTFSITAPIISPPTTIKPNDQLLLYSTSAQDLFDGKVDLVSYKPYKITNTSNEPFVIKTPTETIEIASNSTENVIFTSDAVDMFSGNTYQTSMVSTNKLPELYTQTFVSNAGEEIHLGKLQATTGYRFTIKDDFTDQLDITVTGPVTYKIAKKTLNEIVVDITLAAYQNRGEFERFTENSNSEFFMSYFTITVKDLYAPHKVSDNGLFKYTEW